MHVVMKEMQRRKIKLRLSVSTATLLLGFGWLLICALEQNHCETLKKYILFSHSQHRLTLLYCRTEMQDSSITHIEEAAVLCMFNQSNPTMKSS